jgi:hypothetical protein
MTKNLETIVAEIDKASVTANKNLEDLHPNVRGGWSLAILDAKDKLKVLRGEYKTALFKSAVAIFPEGEAAKVAEFALLVRDENEGLSVNAHALYERLADALEPTFSEARTWGIAQTHKLHLLLQEVMFELSIAEIPFPSTAQEVVVPTREALVAQVRSMLRDSVGDDLNRLYLEKLIVDEATKIRYTNERTPVLILGASQDEAPALAKFMALGSFRIKITNEDVVNKDFMIQAFKQANQALRKKKHG